jgi:hypothetical protein
MEEYVRAGFAFIGAAWFLWGALIVVNARFYKWWRDRFWREPNDEQFSMTSLINNRYLNAGGLAVLGTYMVYLAIFFK